MGLVRSLCVAVLVATAASTQATVITVDSQTSTDGWTVGNPLLGLSLAMRDTRSGAPGVHGVAGSLASAGGRGSAGLLSRIAGIRISPELRDAALGERPCADLGGATSFLVGEAAGNGPGDGDPFADFGRPEACDRASLLVATAPTDGQALGESPVLSFTLSAEDIPCIETGVSSEEAGSSSAGAARPSEEVGARTPPSPARPGRLRFALIPWLSVAGVLALGGLWLRRRRRLKPSHD